MPLLTNVSNWFAEHVSPKENENTEELSPMQTGEVLRRPVVSVTSLESARELHVELSSEEQAHALRNSIEPVRQQLLLHPLYGAVSTLPRLRRFMAIHVYAVWDFMCLAKRLQRDFTSMGTLWLPPKRPSLARFINGLIMGEESDIDPNGGVASHVELYLSAMDEVGADTTSVREFLSLLEYGAEVEVALAAADAPLSARIFVGNTLETVYHGSTVEVLSSFLYGREDLIPAMFQRLLPRWKESQRAKSFAYYVERHIELDGDDHGPAAQKALAELCGRDRGSWQSARHSAHRAICSRIELWNSVIAELE